MFVGTPENPKYEFLVSTIVKLRWDANDDFVDANDADFYEILVDGASYTSIKADRPS